MPAQPVAATQASHRGTLEGVYFFKMKKAKAVPAREIPAVICHSCLVL